MQSLIRRPVQRGAQYHAARAYMRRDPAPSRWAYRWQRLWLTPMWRFGFRVVLPLLALVGVAVLLLSDPVRAAALRAQMAQVTDTVQHREAFMLTTLSIEGASPDLADALRAKLNVSLPISSFDLDLDALRAAAQNLPAVSEAKVQMRAGGLLRVVITERVPALVWRKGDDLILLDASGHPVAGLHARADRPDLPLIAGQGADLAAAEALDLIAAAGPIAARMQGLVRMGARRWDIVLDHGQRLMLPQDDPIAALDRALALDAAERLFDRDILAIDLRYGPRPVLRLTPYALAQRLQSLGQGQLVESTL
jgi:cell division protein FtsQ